MDPISRERYNGFLRWKVFAIFFEAMNALALGVLLDSDTAINATNLELFVRAIMGGGNASVRKTRC